MRNKGGVLSAHFGQTSDRTLRYFAHEAEAGGAPELLRAGGRDWQITYGQQTVERSADVFIMTAHGSNLMNDIAQVRRLCPNALIVVWLFDNHLRLVNDLLNIFSSDAYAVSHSFATLESWGTPDIEFLGHVPAASTQWSLSDIGEVLAETPLASRSDALHAAYVDYDWSSRSPFLRGLSRAVPESAVRLMRPDDRSPYFGTSKRSQVREWCGFKASLVVPVAGDLSTRFFDALMCGLIPVVADDVVDLARVVPPDLWQELPILTYRAGDYGSVRERHAEAIARFDRDGEAGVRRRHQYAADNHRLINRLTEILAAVLEGS